MSLAKIKAKETKTKTKSKVKTINKVKVFLANPLTPKCPSLEETDIEQLQQLLKNAIKENNQTPRAFATAAHIYIGLESSLRAINNGRAACVLLSSNIAPRYILRLVARNVAIKDETTPTYVESQLEHITENIFGVRALALVLPKDSKILGAELSAWIEAHQKPKVPKINNVLPPIERRKKSKTVISEQSLSLTSKPNQMKSCDQEMPVKSWSGDYISFGNTITNMDVEEVNDEDKLQGALSQIVNKAKQQHRISPELTMPIATETKTELVAENKIKEAVEVEGPTDSDQDDFLSGYAPLTVHKICPNPNRKPKKKRNKKRNANLKQ